jgi:hypothetical protein
VSILQTLLAVLLAASIAGAQTVDLDIAGGGLWVDTNVEVRARDEIVITATGRLTLSDGQQITPAGARRGWRDMLRTYPVNAAGQGALIGRLGDAATAQPFLVGPSLRWQAPKDGRLFLGINRSGNGAPKGSFHVKIEFAARAPETSSRLEYQLAEITREIVDRFPRRVMDKDGNPGDATNFLFVGSERRIMEALRAAGWVEVDKSNEAAVLHGVLAVLDKRAYLTLPMSELMLFGRPQDHGMAHADPVAVVAERHHFRIWKAPFRVDGEEIWVGAGTHDIGFERDRRNNGITHKIDPEIDKEREFIGASVMETGLVAKLSYVTPSQPVKEARTATGGTFRSDGRMLVIHLIPEVSVPDPAAGEQTGRSIFDGLGRN